MGVVGLLLQEFWFKWVFHKDIDPYDRIKLDNKVNDFFFAIKKALTSVL